jgi:hypothetical protein
MQKSHSCLIAALNYPNCATEIAMQDLLIGPRQRACNDAALSQGIVIDASNHRTTS